MSELLIREIIHSVGKSSEIIIENFDKLIKSNENIYSIISSIPNNKKIIYVFISFGIILFITKYDVRLNLILGLLLSVIVIYYLISKDSTLIENFIENKDLQLKFLNNLLFYEKDKYVNSVINDDFNINPPFEQSYLYLNPLIVEFYYNVREYSQYNLSNYIRSLHKINEILGICYQMNVGLENPYQNYVNVKKLYKDALNIYQCIIHSLPSDATTYNKFNKSLKVLQSLLVTHVNNARTICKIKNSKEDININTLPDSIIESNISENDMNTKDFSYNFSFY